MSSDNSWMVVPLRVSLSAGLTASSPTCRSASVDAVYALTRCCSME